MKGVQLWKCGACGYEYDSPIRISEVWCMTRTKGKKCRGTMKVIKGLPTREEEANAKAKEEGKPSKKRTGRSG